MRLISGADLFDAFSALARMEQIVKDAQMTDDNTRTTTAGYTAQPDAKVALVNEFKADEERLLRKLDEIANAWRHDPEWLSEGRKTLQIAFMEINRAVFQPQRIRLPEDE